MEQEVWKPVVGYEGLYEVSSLGNVSSVCRVIEVNHSQRQKTIPYKILSPYTNHGYKMIDLHIKNKKKYKVHRLVAAAFIPNPENKPFVNHINSIRTDNRVENLEWCTQKENMQHGVMYGNILSGEGGTNAKLKNEQVLEIFKRAQAGESHKNISKDYGIDRRTVCNISKKNTWKKLLQNT
jgi:hypothetical protein